MRTLERTFRTCLLPMAVLVPLVAGAEDTRSFTFYVQQAWPQQSVTNRQIQDINRMFGTNFDDWSDDLRRYITDVRSGKSASGKQYAARYVCSLVADLHRTLLYGGWAGNPRSHLRRVYEAAPLAFIADDCDRRRMFHEHTSGTTGNPKGALIPHAALMGNLPGFVVMLDPTGGPISGAKNWSSGYMPASYQGTVLRSAGDPILDLQRPEGMTAPMQRRILDTLREYNSDHAAAHQHRWRRGQRAVRRAFASAG